MKRRRRSGHPRRGAALILTLIFVALFACLAVAVATTSGMNLVVSRNRLEGHHARAVAETGLQFMQKKLGGLEVEGSTAEDLHEEIGLHLASELLGTTMLSVDSGLAWSADAVELGPLALPHPSGRTSALDITVVSDGGVGEDPRIVVTSSAAVGQAVRAVAYRFSVVGGGIGWSHGIQSRARMRITGSARIEGVNDPSEGSILCSTDRRGDSIRMTGSAHVSGDVTVTNPDGRIRKIGHVTIGGDEVIGAGEPPLPEIDAERFRDMATNTFSGHSVGNRTYENIRIPAGTNPVFVGNTTFLGVVYVESPNRINFVGNTNMCALIVCEEPAVDNLNANRLSFVGNMSSSSVAGLPDEPQFDEVRDETGTFLLAPGFDVRFTGNFHTLSGCMAASGFRFTGNAGGTVRGGILCLDDTHFRMTGRARLAFDLSGADPTPAGFVGAARLVCVAGTYTEE